jgi:hypothetical protein
VLVPETPPVEVPPVLEPPVGPAPPVVSVFFAGSSSPLHAEITAAPRRAQASGALSSLFIGINLVVT